MDRRDFLKVLGLTSGTAVISSCGVDKANEKIIPYVIPPEEEVYPGKALYYNSTCTECPAGCGVQVTVKEKVYDDMRDLYPTKLEGIEDHPINEGALCARGQAGLFRLYHPDRIRRPMIRDEGGNHRIVTWKEALERIQGELQSANRSGKSNLYFSGSSTGTISTLIDNFCEVNQINRLPEYEVFNHANVKEAGRVVFKKKDIPNYKIEKCDFLFTLGADIFETFLSPVYFASHFAKAKKNDKFHWYHAEPHVSLTGSQADQRFAVKPRSEMVLLTFLIQSILEKNRQKRSINIEIIRALPNYSLIQASRITGISQEKLSELAERLSLAEKPLIICGGVSAAQDKGLEAVVLALLLQWILGMDEEVMEYSQVAVNANVGSISDVKNTLSQLDNGTVGVFFLSRTNPVQTLPQSFEFRDGMKKAQLTIGLGDTLNETVKECDIILPLSHSLESWGDAVPEAGLHTVLQPTIKPQFDSLTEGDILLLLMNDQVPDVSMNPFKDYLFAEWERLYGENQKSDILKKGYIRKSITSARLKINFREVRAFLQNMKFPTDEPKNWLCLTPSLRFFDGRGSNLPILNEIPDPLTSVSYGNWISLSENTAQEWRVRDRDEVILTDNNFTIKLPVKIQKLIPDNIFMINRASSNIPETKVDPRSGEASSFIANVNLSKTGVRIALPALAGSMVEEGRGLLPHEDDHSHGHDGEHERWYPEHEHDNYRWGMAIDLDSCIGCNACAAACYVENNIPIVGKEEHLLGREMSWIRIQPYFDGAEKMEFVPMLCQHCDNAPCEPVCPVYAAYHNPEGLNVQVYNRCVGTRYCANNCPYKVRRFNWFDHRLPEPLDKMYNPDVSVRDRGIMEKCTFCIQRIRAAKDLAKDENRLVEDGEVIPACAQTCPAKAITFGNLEDKNSHVYKLAHSEKAYRALDELGTEPAVNYLRKRGKKHEA
jgi:molybdopterin-containing oxidoreductase family iron-sulfur binding subunit